MEKKVFYITNNRFKFIAWLLFLMFLVFMLLIYLKADEMTHHPCQLCAKYMGEEVHCYTKTLTRVYFPNYTVVEKGG